jgi:hypothetical protein
MGASGENKFQRHHFAAILTEQSLPFAGKGEGEFRGFAKHRGLARE